MDKLVKQLEANDEFVRVVDSAGIAFHSHLIQPAAEQLRKLISPLIPQPKPRSAKWLSTSHNFASEQEPQWCTVDYFVNNLANPVNFYGALSKVPANAIVIEVGPHSLLRAIVRETLPESRYINTMQKSEDNSRVLMKAIGECYAAGLDLIWPLQPSEKNVEENFIFPLYCDWLHHEKWEVPREDQAPDTKAGAAAFTYTINIDSEEFAYIKDHALNNKVVIPGMFYVYLAWKSLATLARKSLEDTNLFARHVAFHRPVILANTNEAVLKVSLLSATGEFQITDGKDLVTSGIVQEHDDNNLSAYKPALKHAQAIRLNREEFYKELRLRGYNYGDHFQGVQSVSLDGSSASIAWNLNWVSFLDSMLQCGVMHAARRTIIPTYIRELRVCPQNMPNNESVDIVAQKNINRTWSPVAVIDGGKFSQTASTQQPSQAKLLSHRFSPYFQTHCLDHPGEEEAKEYFFTTQNYIVSSALRLIENKMRLTEIPAHIQSLYNLLRTIDHSEPDNDKLDRYRNHPNAVLLRLATHIFQSDIDILSDAMPAIVSFSEHNELYEKDMIAAYFYNEKYLGSLLKTFYENIDGVRPVKICEVGTGTGGITTHVLQTLRSRQDRYILTDVSAGFFDNLKNKFASYRTVTDYRVWDINNPAPESLQGECDLVIANNVLHACSDIKNSLANIHQSLSDNGFFILFEPTHGYGTMLGVWGFIGDLWHYTDGETRDHGPLLSHKKWLSVLSDGGFDVVSYQDSGYSTTIYLCKKKPLIQNSLVIPFLLNEQRIEEVTHAVQQCTAASGTRVWLTGNIASAPGLIGLANCARREPNNGCLRTVFVAQADEPGAQAVEMAKNHDLAVNVYKDGQWGNYQFSTLAAAAPLLSSNAYIKIGTPGDLSSLQWTVAAPPLKNTMLVYAKALSLNFKDLMLASGKLAAEAFAGDINSNIGGEFAGITEDGRRVMGFVQSPLTNLIKVDHRDLDQVYEIPENWSFLQAASVPVAYLTAYYSLIVKANVQPGQRVLIHSGTSSVGQAAIRVALATGCEVFTTVGSDSKRDYIVKTFPQIAVDHIGSSRSITFESQFMEITQGQGMDVVLNSLSGERLMASLRLTARYGVFLEIGKYDMVSDSKIGMELLLREITLHGVGVNNLLVDGKRKLEQLKTLLIEGIDTGIVQPLPVRSFSPDEIEPAFRFMSSGKHIGKVVIDLGDVNEAKPKPVLAKPEFWCDPNKCYIITGGLGGFGLELAEWLISRGARNMVLTSRSGIKNNYQKYRVQRWMENGVSTSISTLDVAREPDVQQLLEETQQQHPIGGIFHLAMVMEDALLVNQHYDKFKKVSSVKLDACQYLDKHTRTICPELEHFVVFSSLSGAAGNPGQSSYGYANFGMDRVCERRHRDGYPALAIQWGSIDDVGFVNENRDRVNVKALGATEQSLTSCLHSLNIFLCRNEPIVASYVPYTDTKDEPDAIAANKSLSAETLVDDIKNILGVKSDQTIDEQQTLHSIGMDSLMAVELQVKLQNDYDLQIELDEMRQLNVDTLKEKYLLSHIQAPRDSEETDNKTNAPQRALFETILPQNGQDREILFFTGTAMNPKPLLAEIELPARCKLTLVNYEICENISQLSTLVERYIRALEQNITSLKLVGFSTGALVLLRIMQTMDLSNLSRPVLTTSISPARPEIYARLQELTLDQLNAISETDGLNQISALPWFGSMDRPPFAVIKEQFKFMHSEPFHDTDFGRVDEMILPEEDSICWTRQQGQKHADKITRLPGKHDLRTLPLKDILMKGLED
jgi:fatty acid synthase